MGVNDADRLLTYREVAERLYVSLSTAQRLGRSGRLDVIRLTSQTHRIRESSVKRLIEHASGAHQLQEAS